MCGTDAKVCLAKHEKRQKNNDTGHTVLLTNDSTKGGYRKKAKSHHKIDFKVVD